MIKKPPTNTREKATLGKARSPQKTSLNNFLKYEASNYSFENLPRSISQIKKDIADKKRRNLRKRHKTYVVGLDRNQDVGKFNPIYRVGKQKSAHEKYKSNIRNYGKTKTLTGIDLQPLDEMNKARKKFMKVANELDEKNFIKLRNALSKKYKFKNRYTLCCCCLKFKDIRNAYMTILVNDILIAANMSTLAYIVTFELIYASPGILFFIVATITYVHWRAQDQIFDKFNQYYLVCRWIFYIGLTFPYGRILYEIIPIIYSKKKISDSNLTLSEKQWLSLFSINKLFFLASILIYLLIYLLSNIYWNIVMRRILQEWDRMLEYERKKFKHTLSVTFKKKSLHKMRFLTKWRHQLKSCKKKSVLDFVDPLIALNQPNINKGEEISDRHIDEEESETFMKKRNKIKKDLTPKFSKPSKHSEDKENSHPSKHIALWSSAMRNNPNPTPAFSPFMETKSIEFPFEYDSENGGALVQKVPISKVIKTIALEQNLPSPALDKEDKSHQLGPTSSHRVEQEGQASIKGKSTFSMHVGKLFPPNSHEAININEVVLRKEASDFRDFNVNSNNQANFDFLWFTNREFDYFD